MKYNRWKEESENKFEIHISGDKIGLEMLHERYINFNMVWISIYL